MSLPLNQFAVFVGGFPTQQFSVEMASDRNIVGRMLPLRWYHKSEFALGITYLGNGPRTADAADIRTHECSITRLPDFQPGRVCQLAVMDCDVPSPNDGR